MSKAFSVHRYSITSCCWEINDEPTFSAVDVHMMSAQMRTRGVPGTPFFTVSERRRTYLTPRGSDTNQGLTWNPVFQVFERRRSQLPPRARGRLCVRESIERNATCPCIRQSIEK